MPAATRAFHIDPHELRPGAILFALTMAAYAGAHYLIPREAHIAIAPIVALVFLFFTTPRLWPFAYGGALAGAFLLRAAPAIVIIEPIALALAAASGAALLRKMHFDPIFRSNRDLSSLLLTLIVTSLIVPTFGVITEAFRGGAYSADAWGLWYVGTFCTALILAPLLLRWSAKLKFARTQAEKVELFSVFSFLFATEYAIFVVHLPRLIGLPVVYFLIIPLFWIALRLRPRFVTLALFITAVFALVNALMLPNPPGGFVEYLFSSETFLIVLALIFLIIGSLEEERRRTVNILRSQLVNLENITARLSSESKAKNDFIAILAHELRNPLAPIATAIDLLKIKGLEEREEAQTLDMMASQMQSVRRLLDDLLDISRITEGKTDLVRERFSLVSVLGKSILVTASQIQERHQFLDFKSPSERLEIIGDPLRIEQVFSNLLTNASKYSDSGDTIRMAVRKNGAMAEVEIRDEGIGISPDALEQIFLPFHQAHRGERMKKGLGIGLALVRNFVEMHEGTVTAQSAGHGKGSRFTVRLPLALPEEDIGAPRKKEGSLALIADKDDIAAGTLGETLELQGWRVAYAYSARQTIDKALRLAPKAVLLDAAMQDARNKSIAHALRAGGFKGKIISLIGRAGLGTPSQEIAVDIRLAKPVNPDELKAALSPLA